jgi:MFS family permease
MSDSTAEANSGSSMNIWRSLKGLPHDVWVLSLATLINRAGTMVLPFLVLYLTQELGFSAPRAGLTLAVYGAGSIIASPISGRLTDRIGPLPIMRASLVLAGILLFVYPFVHTFSAVILVTLAWAIVTEMFRPANLALVADIVPVEKLKPAYALQRLAINLGMSIGPAAAGFIATRSFRWIFVVNGATTLIAAVVLIATPLSVVHRPSAEPSKGGWRSLHRTLVLDDPRMLLFLSALFLTGIVFFQIEGPLPLFLVEDLHLSPAFYGGLFTLNTVMIVFMEVPLNAATAHWPHRRGLALGALLFAIGSGMFAFPGGPITIVVAMIVWTFGEMLLFPQAAAYVAEIAPLARRGEYMGAYSLAFSLAFAVAPWAGTTGYARFGARPLWIAVFLVGAISAWMMMHVRERDSG